MKLTPAELEILRARLHPSERARLRADGMLEPRLPPMHFCGGLEAPYIVEPSLSWDSESPPNADAAAPSSNTKAPSAPDMLTPYELEQLKQNGNEAIAYARRAFNLEK